MLSVAIAEGSPVRVMLLAVLVVLGLLARGTAARADVPAYLPVEGELADSHGNALDGQVAIRFRLYDHAEPEGDDEAILYEEDVPLVSVVDGHFTVYLGFYEKLDLALFQDQRLYLGLLVSGDSEELAPRPALDTVPFAIGAQFCADAERLEGLGADA